MTHTADNTDRQETAMAQPLTGIWKSTDKRENRHIYVTSTFGSYAYGFRCDARGMRLGKETSREVRVLLNGYGTGLARYRRPERSSVGGTTTSSEEQA